MRNIFIMLLLWPMGFLVEAQIPNAGFELWDNQPVLKDWETNSRPLTLPPYDPYIVRQDTERYSGNYSANFYANDVFKPFATTTFPVSFHPLDLSLYYKLSFAPCVNNVGFPEKDTASVLVEVLNNGVVVDQGYWERTSTNFSFTQLVIPISQNAVVFDSCRITIWGGKNVGGCGIIAVATQFKVDQLELRYSSAGCIDTSQVDTGVFCPGLFDPVCGCNGQTYGNSCEAYYYGGVTSWSQGACGAGVCHAEYTAVVLGDSVVLSDASSASDSIVAWSYDFGDGTTDTMASVLHVFPGPGTYNVCLTILSLSGCADTFCDSVTIDTLTGCIDSAQMCPLCPCMFIYAPVCGCDNNTYSNACFAQNAGITSWTQGACIPNGGGGCSAGFSFHKQIDSVWFTNSSTAASITGYLWEFGDGDTSSQQNPGHVYLNDSIYTVCLTLFGKDSLGNSCTDQFCDTIIITHDCIDSTLLCGFLLCCDFVPQLPVCGCDSVTYNNSCEATSFYGVSSYYPGPCVTTGIDKSASVISQISIAPNPASDLINVTYVTSQPGKVELRVTNVIGQTMKSIRYLSEKSGIQRTQIDVADLQKGIYFLQVESKGLRKTKTFIVE